ncbi:MAG: ABC transporter substrate-binding protein [Thermaurantiacus sp.]
MASLAAIIALVLGPAIAGCAPTGGTALADPPGAHARIVSINPCVDALLRELAIDDRILAISHYSQDPRATSVPLEWAQHFPATGGTAEEVIAHRPDLVLAGPHVAPATLAALERLGIGIMLLPVPVTVAESVAQVRELGARLGAEEPAEALVRRIDAAVADAAATGSDSATALVWQAGGMVPGARTLVGDLMRQAGLRNLSAEHGLADWDVIGLERLIARPPDLLLSPAVAQASGDRLLAHPALGRLGDAFVGAEFPARLVHCGGPTIIDAAAVLAAGRERATRP